MTSARIDLTHVLSYVWEQLWLKKQHSVASSRQSQGVYPTTSVEMKGSFTCRRRRCLSRTRYVVEKLFGICKTFSFHFTCAFTNPTSVRLSIRRCLSFVSLCFSLSPNIARRKPDNHILCASRCTLRTSQRTSLQKALSIFRMSLLVRQRPVPMSLKSSRWQSAWLKTYPRAALSHASTTIGTLICGLCKWRRSHDPDTCSAVV